jgi:glycosyltransferase involved in cell wall biosynthesis
LLGRSGTTLPPDPLTLSIVIPAFNESHRLFDTLTTICDHLVRLPWTWEVRVVDDGSGDDTVAIGEAFARTEPRVVVQREPHRGKGGAVKAGLVAARGAYRFMCDADLSMVPDDIARFLPPEACEFDLAIAVREGASARRFHEPTYRHLMGRVFNRAVQWLALPGIEDSQCGFKMFTASAVEAIFPRTHVDGWAFDIEVLVVAREQQLRIIEVPIDWHYREHSQVAMLRDSIGMLRDLLAISARARRGAYRGETAKAVRRPAM